MGRAQQRRGAQSEDEQGHRQHDRCEQEAKAGEHGARKSWKGLANGNAVATQLELADGRSTLNDSQKRALRGRASAGTRPLAEQICRALERRNQARQRDESGSSKNSATIFRRSKKYRPTRYR